MRLARSLPSAPSASTRDPLQFFNSLLKGEVQTNRVAVTGILLERIGRTRPAALVAKIAVKVAINLVTKIQQDIIRVCRNQCCTGRNDGLWLILIFVVIETEGGANSRSNGVMKLQAGAERRLACRLTISRRLRFDSVSTCPDNRRLRAESISQRAFDIGIGLILTSLN